MMKRFKYLTSRVINLRSGIIILSVLFLGANSQSGLSDLPDGERREIDLDHFVPDVKFVINGSYYNDEMYLVRLHNSSRNSNGRISLAGWKVNVNKGGKILLKVSEDNGKSWVEKSWKDLSRSNKETQTKILKLGDIDDVSDWDIVGATDIFFVIEGFQNFDYVELIATFYYESIGSCPAGYFNCEGDVKSGCVKTKNHLGMEIESVVEDKKRNSEVRRCISKDLKCNRRPNCGLKCRNEENDCYLIEDKRQIRWYEIQYLLTILLAGLFFILSPICIVIFLFYHRRLNLARSIERHNNRGRQNSVYTSSPSNDVPPTYEDVHDIKNPPPSFETAIATTQQSTGLDNPVAVSDEIPSV